MKSLPTISIRMQSMVLKVRTYERILSSGTIIMAVLLLTYFFLLPTLNQARNIIVEQQTTQPRLQLLSQKESQLSQLDVAVYRSALERMQLVIPQSKDFVSLFSTFDALEVKTGVSIRGTDFQLGIVSTRSAQLVRSPKTGAYSIPLHLVVEAQRDQLLQFLEHMSDLTGRFITIDSLQWGIGENDSVKAQLSGQAYFLPIAETIGGLDAPIPSFSPSQTDLFTTISALPAPVSAGDASSSVPTGKTNLFE